MYKMPSGNGFTSEKNLQVLGHPNMIIWNTAFTFSCTCNAYQASASCCLNYDYWLCSIYLRISHV